MQWFYARGPDATQQMATELFAKHVMVKQPWFPVTHRIHGAAIYGNIYHQYTPNVSIYIYIPYMDPMDKNSQPNQSNDGWCVRVSVGRSSTSVA